MVQYHYEHLDKVNLTKEKEMRELTSLINQMADQGWELDRLIQSGQSNPTIWGVFFKK